MTRRTLVAATTAVAALLIGLVAPLGTPRAGGLDEALDWAPVYDPGRAIEPGSPLDFTKLFPVRPIGETDRIRIAPDGRFVSGPADSPRRERFFCASLAWSPASGSYPDKKTADVYARQLAMAGYNLARFHFTDAILMTDRDRDFDFDPVQLDRFHYLMAALKKNGIHWMIDVLTSQNGAIGGVYPHRWEDRHNLKMRLHVEVAARRHWERLADRLLGATNPYTGLPPARDPALALVVATNENGLEFTAILEQDRTGTPYAAILQSPFNAWLKQRYGTDARLKKAWGALWPGESLANGTIRLPASRSSRGPRMRDLQLFFHERERDTFAWSAAYLKKLGYDGPVSAYNNWSVTAAHLSRGILPAVTMNAYHDIVLSLAPGTTIEQSSSITNAAGYIRDLIGSRWHGKPFLVTEHHHLFWNRYRYESGLLVPAIAGLQDWDGICRHGPGPIDLTADSDLPHKKHILPYAIGLDPVARAAETLSALVYRRGEARPAETELLIPLQDAGAILDDGQGRWPDDLTRLGLLTRLAITARPRRGPASDTPSAENGTDARLEPEGFAGQPGWSRPSALAATVTRLRSAGVLPATNRTDLENGVYHSATGQFELDATRRRASFVSPTTEAVAFDALDAPVTLDRLTVEKATPQGLFALTALDNRPLGESAAILVVYATDARNSNMSFADAEARRILDYGARPTILRRGILEARLRTSGAGAWTLTRLDLSGRPLTKEKVPQLERQLTFRIETAPSSSGKPTTFWLLSR